MNRKTDKPKQKNGNVSFRKADAVLGAVLLTAGLLISFCLWSALRRGISGTSGLQVVISADGQTYGRYSLSEDRLIEVTTAEGENEVEIRDGSVRMAKASCRNQICVETGSISMAGESIICLPNRVIVEIRSTKGQEDAYDAIVR